VLQTGLNVKFKFKNYDETYLLNDIIETRKNMVVPHNEHEMQIVRVVGNDVDNSCSATIFNKLYPEFEKTHLKILNKAFFIKEEEEVNIIKTRAQMITSYEHIQCGINKQGFPVLFISKWLSYNDRIRRMDDIGIYPDAADCPANIFNMWRPFAVDLMTGEYTPNEPAKDRFFNHIKILCGNDADTCTYFIKWLAHMLKFPKRKSTCPTLISLQGAGKNTLITGLTRIFGDKRVFCTANPSRDVWGSFNGV
jgi:hypothetical protein